MCAAALPATNRQLQPPALQECLSQGPAGQGGACEPGFLGANMLLTKNAVSLRGTTIQDYAQNKHQQHLCQGPGQYLLPMQVVLASGNARKEEILNSFKFLRPQNRFEPKFMLSEKCEESGAQGHPLFNFLQEALPAPSNDATAHDQPQVHHLVSSVM